MAYGVTEYPNTFKRQDAFPLDNTSLFNSMEAALQYINKPNSTAYGGQIISINDNGSYSIYVVQIINNAKTLVNIMPQILNNLTYNVGTYCLYNYNDDVMNENSELMFDINYPLRASSYSMYLNNSNEPVNDELIQIGHSISIFLGIATFDQINEFTIKLFDDNSNELLTLYAKTIWSNENIKLGILSLIR